MRYMYMAQYKYIVNIEHYEHYTSSVNNVMVLNIGTFEKLS